MTCRKGRKHVYTHRCRGNEKLLQGTCIVRVGHGMLIKGVMTPHPAEFPPTPSRQFLTGGADEDPVHWLGGVAQ